jgi:hypothetical protein
MPQEARSGFLPMEDILVPRIVRISAHLSPETVRALIAACYALLAALHLLT